MVRVYKDKNGNEIKGGMEIRHDDGDVERVYECGNDFGINAVNMRYAKIHPELELEHGDELYLLYQFNLKEWEIVK